MQAIVKYKEQISAAIQKTGRIPADLMPTNKEQSVELMFAFPAQYYASMKPAKISDVFDSNVCSIALLSKEHGEMATRAAMVYILTDLSLFFNIGKTMTEYQIGALTDMIIEDFYYLKFDDFKLCFGNAKRGLYGDVYGVDGSVVYKWLNQYVCERDNLCIEMNIASKPSHEVSDENYQKFMQELTEKFEIENKNKSRRN
jgi:hypothetical protein